MAISTAATERFFRTRGSDPALGKAVTILLVAALLAGGRSHELQYAVVSLAALPALYLLLRDPRPIDRSALFILAAVALAAAQIIPLPPSIWRSLAGRDTVSTTLEAAGLTPGWRPLSVAPWATFTALLGLLAPITAFFAARRAGWRVVKLMLAGTLFFAAFSALVGTAQRLTGGLTLYKVGHEGFATGLFSNRNHLADLLLAGVVAVPLLLNGGGSANSGRAPMAAVLSVLAFLLALGVFATTSRAGMVLVGPTLAVSLFMIWRPARRHYVLVLGGFILIVAIVLSLKGLDPVFNRFAASEAGDDRAVIRETAPVAIRAFWPWGSGYGTFVPVYAAFEDLDMLHPSYAIEAHNDYIQIALEGGLAGTLTMLVGLGGIGWTMLALLRRRAPVELLAPSAIILLLLAHSAVDYPLRMPALAVLFAICCGGLDAVRQTFANSRENA